MKNPDWTLISNIQIAGVPVQLKGERQGGQSWIFRGQFNQQEELQGNTTSLSDKQGSKSIKFAELFEDLVDKFGIEKLPVDLGDVALECLSIELLTGDKSRFTLSARFTIADKSFNCYLIIEGSNYVFGIGFAPLIDLGNFPLFGNEINKAFAINDISIIYARINDGTVWKEFTPPALATIDHQATVNSSQTFELTKGFHIPLSLNVAGKSLPPILLELPNDEKNTSQLRQNKKLKQAASSSTAVAIRPAAHKQQLNKAEQTSTSLTKWFSLQKTVGPLQFRRLGLSWISRNGEPGRLGILLDSAVSLSGLTIGLNGLEVSMPLSTPIEPRFDLAGLDVAYEGGQVVFSGGLLKHYRMVRDRKVLQYTGQILVKAETFTLTALGSYSELNGQDSLFIFGVYDGVLGGPAPFYVTGLALGVGYNSTLALPAVEKVESFPLMQAAMQPGRFNTESLKQAILPSVGDRWLAAGVKFNSFKMVDTFALFSAVFSSRQQFAILGQSKLTVPAQAKEDKCAVYAELSLRGVLDPQAGVFAIEGRLNQNSYIFSKALRLTGGFAYYVWFGNARDEGDFVISLGGYHPAFRPPAHYPVVPRTRIRGKIGALTITGEAYLSLTPSCLMAGQKLEAVFKSGKVKATFVAYADFIVAWAPFHYDARIGISMAVSVRLWRTYKLEVSAKMHIWGPPFAGTARVSLWMISFTVEFGADSQPPPRLEWHEFQQSFLPVNQAGRTSLSTIRISAGLVREVKKQQGEKEIVFRVVNPHELIIETDSAVPCSEVCLGEKKVSELKKSSIGIRPMELRSLTSRHSISIKAGNTQAANVEVIESQFSHVQSSRKNFPEALWSANKASGKPEARMIKQVPSGAVLRVQAKTPQHRLGPFLVEKFKYEHIKKSIPWLVLAAPMSIEQKDFEIDSENTLRIQIRNGLTRYLAKTKASSWNEISMENTANSPSEYFQAKPSSAVLGQRLELLN